MTGPLRLRKSHLMARNTYRPSSSSLGAGNCHHQQHFCLHSTACRRASGHHARYLPSAKDADDRIIGTRGNRRGYPRPELDLQCIYSTRLKCMRHTNRAATAASPTYTSRNTPPLASATRKSQHHHNSTTTHHNAATTRNDNENHGRLWRRC